MSKPGTLRFATFLAPNVYPLYQFMAQYVGEKLGLSTEIRVGLSFDQFSHREVDVGLI